MNSQGTQKAPPRRGSTGGLLIETAIALMVFVVIGTGVLVGVSVMHTSGRATASQATGENLARNQMEYLFSLPYQEPPSFYPTVPVPEGYAVTAEAQEYEAGDPNIQKVVVVVTFWGAEAMTLETFRVKD